jgi:hypothetical protein
MKRMGFALFAVLLSLACMTAAQDNSAEPPQNGPGAKLRADLKKAVQNGHLTDEQKSSMQSAGAALRQAAEARQSGQKVDRNAVKKAFSDIKKVADSDAFQPEDKQAVKADLEAMKEKGKEARGGRRRGIFRQALGGGGI